MDGRGDGCKTWERCDVVVLTRLVTRFSWIAGLNRYTGPGYQPINQWLRDIAVLPPEAQREAALDPSSSYGNTVRALTAALRKLACASNEEEASRPVYRGLRGWVCPVNVCQGKVLDMWASCVDWRTIDRAPW